MAASAHARRTTARRSRRRPAARRKPAARRRPSRIKWDRVGRIALTLVLAAVLYSYLNPAIELVKTYTATTAAKAEFHERLAENKRYHRRVQSADDPVAIARRARAQGLLAEGERPLVVRDLKP